MKYEKLIAQALVEDLGTGDITTAALPLEHLTQVCFLVAKESGVIAGLEVAKQAFLQVDPEIRFIAYCKDGDLVSIGQDVVKIEGQASSLLKAERVALNFLQRLSGIATATRLLTEAIKPYAAKLLDTRKTTPLLRELEKYAVKIGGGVNHRYGLYDMYLIKENHIRAVGGITKAVEAVKKYNPNYKIEVETTNLAEVQEAYNCGVDRIMLDNMPLELMQEAVEMFGSSVELEASGNVTLLTINKIAATGVHYISSGSITHSFKSLDLSLLFKEQK